jgi:hypothetical protein
MSEPALELVEPANGSDVPEVPENTSAFEPKSFLTLAADDHEHAVALFPREEQEPKGWRIIPRLNVLKATMAALGVIAAIEFGLLVFRPAPVPAEEPVAPTSLVTIETIPAGASIVIDNHQEGVTPATVSLNPGQYHLSLASGSLKREITMVVRAGVNSTERIYLGDTDGESAIGDSDRRAAESLQHPLPLKPPPAAAEPAAPSGAVGGWISVNAPIDVQLYEKGALIGSNQSDRIMLPVGRHVLDVVNTALGYKVSSTIQIAPGVVTQLRPEIPSTTLNINAVPWAEVVLDGKRLGPTPIGNVSLAIGAHDVVFTHPSLGERRQQVVVTVNGPNRVSVNLNER